MPNLNKVEEYFKKENNKNINKREDSVRSHRPNPLRGFNFIVHFYNNKLEKSGIIGFSKISGLKITNNIFEIKHTDNNGGTITSKFPGNITYPSVTFEKGVLPYTQLTSGRGSYNRNDFYFYDKLRELQILPSTKFFHKFNILILLYDYKGQRITEDSPASAQKRWALRNAQIQDIEFGTLDASSNDVLIDKFVIVHEGIKYDYGDYISEPDLNNSNILSEIFDIPLRKQQL